MPAPRFDPIKKSAESGQRAAGTDSDDDRIDIVSHLLPNFRARGPLMREWIGRIAKLIHIKSARNFLGQPRRHILIIFRMPASNIRTGQPHFRAKRPDMGNFFLRHLVRNDENTR